MDDVQFNGGIFDAMGLSDAAKANKGKEPKLAERAPLVVPPKLDRLPEPGQKAPENGQLAEIKDPDAEKVKSKEELQREQAAYCHEHYELAKQRGDEAEAANATGPLGPCRPSVLTAIKKWNASEDE